MAIEGIELAEGHVGAGVTYRSHPGARLEDGVISSWNDTFVFVRFNGDYLSKACRPEDLLWGPGWLVQGGGRS